MTRLLAARLAALAIAPWLAVAGCTPRAQERGPTSLSAVAVSVLQVEPSMGAGTLLLPGRVKAREEVTLTARLAARITRLAREGDRFPAAHALAVFAAPETYEAVSAARASLDAAEMRLAQARHDEARAESLVQAGAAAPRELELARVERRAAEATLSSARASDRQWRENTSIAAPFAGVVARRYVDPGQTVSPGQALLAIRSHEIEGIEAAVPESALPRLRGARAWVQAGEGPWMRADLVRVDGMTDPATRTRMATFRSPSAAGLEAGAYARVRLEISPDSVARPAAALAQVPSTGLVRRGSLTGVYVVREGRAWLRWLRLGRQAGNGVEVLAGLTPGETIVLDPRGLRDGQRVLAQP
jgi:RND family efflux transporter MFP subunit